FVHVVREDPRRAGMLFAGTDNAVWWSLDDGAHWTKLRLDMPPAPVYWLVVQERFDDLVVATYGRGFYILDDLAPLRALDADVLAGRTVLVPPRAAYRFQRVQGIHSEASFVTGRDPRYGADINYVLADTTLPVRLTIEDAEGRVVRRLRPTRRRGVNRVWWDLRHPSPRAPRLRTRPPGRPWVPLDGRGERPLRSWDLDLVGGQQGPLAVPGVYTVRLRVGDEEFTEPLTVLKDPWSEGSMADIEAQVALSLRMRDQLDTIADLIDRMEWARVQLEDVQGALAGAEGAQALADEARRVEARAVEVEGALFDVHLTGAREDAFRSPMKLYGRFSALASDVGANSADFAPTEAQRQVHAVLSERLERARAAIDAFFAEDVARLN
ncbi:MAG: glycosyl hydrolase, partial [Gemmatimonadetes bacterium]